MGDVHEPCSYCPHIFPGVPPRPATHCLSTSRKKTSLWPTCTTCKSVIYKKDEASRTALYNLIARPLTWSDVAGSMASQAGPVVVQAHPVAESPPSGAGPAEMLVPPDIQLGRLVSEAHTHAAVEQRAEAAETVASEAVASLLLCHHSCTRMLII